MSQDHIKMLSIDDRMLTTDLDRAGYRNMGIIVRHSTTFSEAQQILSSDKIDIIVINLDYEKIDALGICKHFKSHNTTKDIPLVMTSVQTTAAARNSSLAAGADLFIEQPLPRQYFIEKLKKLLDQVTRSTERIDVGVRVQIHHNKDSYTYEIADLSKTGMLVLCEKQPIPEGSSVKLSFMVPESKKPIEASGTVVRHVKTQGTEPREGLGIRFQSFSGDSERRLERYVEKVSDSSGKMLYYL